MDKTHRKNNRAPAEEESTQYLWIAGGFVGGVLILTIIIIIGIIIWKYVKKQNRSKYDNWARPSPLADGNIPEGMNSSILGRSMSLSHVSISPIISNEQLAVHEDHEMGTDNHLGYFTGGDLKEKNLTPTVPVTPTEYASPAPEGQMSTRITDNGLKDETLPPPPLEECPMPPQPEQDIQNKTLQPFSEGISYRQDENGTQEPINPQNNNADDQHLPPPPPDF